MKVLLIDVYHYNRGGAETVCFNTGSMLEEHGHQVVYYALRWKENKKSKFEKYFPESKETRKGIFRQVINLRNYFYYPDAAKKMEMLIKEEKPDIAHIHLMWGQISPSIFPVLKKYNIPIILTIHDYRIVCPAYSFKDGKGNICEACNGKDFYRCFTHKCTKGSYFLSFFMAAEQYFRNRFFYPLNYIDGFIYVSNFAKKIHEKYMPDIKKKQHITLYNFSQSITDTPKELPLTKYYLFFGRLSYEKGVETLIQAFEKQPALNLKIAGTGPLENILKDKVKTKNIKNIEFVGFKKGKDLKNLIEQAYMTIVPSEWYENNPMSIIESYSVGTPVIGANIGGIPEIIQENMNGFIFQSKDVESLIACIKKADTLNEKQYKNLSLGCIHFAEENLSANNYWNKLLEFYNQILQSNQPTR